MSESGIRFIDPPEPNERLLAYELSGDFTGDDMRTFVERLERLRTPARRPSCIRTWWTGGASISRPSR
jgi:hypothetical protein